MPYALAWLSFKLIFFSHTLFRIMLCISSVLVNSYYFFFLNQSIFVEFVQLQLLGYRKFKLFN